MYDLCLITMCKAETQYLREWVVYHHLRGVDKIILVLDHPEVSADLASATKAISGFEDLVTLVVTPAEYRAENLVERYADPEFHRQGEILTYFLQQIRHKANWVLCLDMDEFAVPVPDKTLPEILHEYTDCAALMLWWRVFGSSGLVELQPSQIVPYVHRQEDNKSLTQFKTVFQPKLFSGMPNAHHPRQTDGAALYFLDRTINSKERWMTAARNKATYTPIYIAHYQIKSKKSFLQKQLRGDVNQKHLDRLDWKMFTKVDQEATLLDTSVRDRFIDELAAFGLNVTIRNNHENNTSHME